MIIAVIGSRSPSGQSKNKVAAYLNSIKDEITEIVTGGAFGMDSMGMEYAEANGIKLTVYRPVGWHNAELCQKLKHEPNDIISTGLNFNERNTLIIKHCDFVVCGDYGNGTIDAMNKALKMGKKVYCFGRYIPGRFFKPTPKGIIFKDKE